jgi:hypothetical protein
MRGSNWRFSRVVKLDINTVVYKPLRGSSYIQLPKFLASKKAIINVKNEDNECFKWCVTRALNPVEKYPQRITAELREQAEKINWNGVEFPVPVSSNVMSKFEKIITSELTYLVIQRILKFIHCIYRNNNTDKLLICCL